MRRFFHLPLICIILLAGCSARAPGSGDPNRIRNYTRCLIQEDQGQGSFWGQWATLPIPLVFDKDFYITDEGAAVGALRRAALTWNEWASLRGLRAFDIREEETQGRDIPEILGCDVMSYAVDVTDVVGIWKIATHGFHRNQRDTCVPNPNTGELGRILYYDEISGSGVQGQTEWISQNSRITGATVLLNFEGFNAPGRQRVDVESLMLHELGHVLGLLHSCNGASDGSDRTTAPACDNAPEVYRDAVMFPYLQVAQERRSLRKNEYDRINCIY